jgi:hypothetical protein
MVESVEPTGASNDVLVFAGSQSTGIWLVLVGAAFAFAAIILSEAPSATASGGGVVGCLLIAIVFSLAASRRQIVEIDLRSYRLRILRQFMGRWTSTLIDCPLDQCRQLARVECETEGQSSYGVYIELADGTRHAIPLKNSTFVEAGRVASQLSDAIGIPRLETKF